MAHGAQNTAAGAFEHMRNAEDARSGAQEPIYLTVTHGERQQYADGLPVLTS